MFFVLRITQSTWRGKAVINVHKVRKMGGACISAKSRTGSVPLSFHLRHRDLMHLSSRTGDTRNQMIRMQQLSALVELASLEKIN